MPSDRTPGVYIEEIPGLPPSVAEVETAIPAFIGYTSSATLITAGDLLGVPKRIQSVLEFEACYGKDPICAVTRANIDKRGNFLSAEIGNRYCLYDSLRLFYDNGGGDCYIVSVGCYKTTSPAVDREELIAGVQAVADVDEPTILLFPDAATLNADDLAAVQRAALAQCGALGDRVAVLDLCLDDPNGAGFRARIGSDNLRYGAAYTPWLRLSYHKPVGYAQVRDCVFMAGIQQAWSQLTTDPAILSALQNLDKLIAASSANAGITSSAAKNRSRYEQVLYDSFIPYRNVIDGVRSTLALCPPSGAIAGVYASVDRQRGVWKAPANISLNSVIAPASAFTASEAAALNIDAASGKSINAIRAFAGKGTLVWGARTLAGNDNEWRYVPVRRFFNTVEESVRKSTYWVVFEPNDANTWARVRGMIDNYLTQKWREGALAGSTPKDAFFVRCGLGTTMTAQDILEGRMTVEIGMAVVRPAEFIILKFSHQLQTG
jgi:phage tail sheath protein FI